MNLECIENTIQLIAKKKGRQKWRLRRAFVDKCRNGCVVHLSFTVGADGTSAGAGDEVLDVLVAGLYAADFVDLPAARRGGIARWCRFATATLLLETGVGDGERGGRVDAGEHRHRHHQKTQEALRYHF